MLHNETEVQTFQENFSKNIKWETENFFTAKNYQKFDIQVTTKLDLYFLLHEISGIVDLRGSKNRILHGKTFQAPKRGLSVGPYHLT